MSVVWSQPTYVKSGRTNGIQATLAIIEKLNLTYPLGLNLSIIIVKIALTRLRIGKCCLNSCLHEINAHPTGLCDTCHEPETVKHYLLQCKNAVTSAVCELCTKLNIPITLSSVLRDFRLVDVIYHRLTWKLIENFRPSVLRSCQCLVYLYIVNTARRVDCIYFSCVFLSCLSCV